MQRRCHGMTPVCVGAIWVLMLAALGLELVEAAAGLPVSH